MSATTPLSSPKGRARQSASFLYKIKIEENGDIKNGTNKLNIHRNTLNYRLERIQKLTGRNPKVLLELFELICSLIWYK
ncbi:helix-turn-helix domain-containing protein [Ectobacillus funiculus]|uniref:Helix-turn-helix domain-containing protein n=1 Tax=Ectobacillus funiculus TaxID=137993 RepID=A0ABV5WD89_9BACI